MWQSYYLMRDTVRYNRPKLITLDVSFMKYGDDFAEEAANRKISVDTSSSPMTEATMTEFCKDPQGVLNQKALDSIKSDLEGTTGHPTITYYSKIQYVWG